MNLLLIAQRILLICVVVLVSGCAGLNFPGYIQAEYPYKHIYYGDFQIVLGEVKNVLADANWKIVKEVDPTLYERNPLVGEGSKNHILVFTNVRKSQRIIYTQVRQLNVYVNQIDGGIEVDVRFRSVKNFYLFKISSFRSDKTIKQLLNQIEQRLLTKK